MSSNDSTLLTLSGAARILKLSEGTVVRLANQGTLPHERDSSGRRVFQRAEMRRIAHERRQRSANRKTKPDQQR